MARRSKGEHAAIVRLRNELADAQSDLDQITVRAPDVVTAGQLQSTGTLVNVGGPATGDRALAIPDLVDDISAYQVPLGSADEAAICTEYFHELSLLRKIPLRTLSWQNYAFFETA